MSIGVNEKHIRTTTNFKCNIKNNNKQTRGKCYKDMHIVNNKEGMSTTKASTT